MWKLSPTFNIVIKFILLPVFIIIVELVIIILGFRMFKNIPFSILRPYKWARRSDYYNNSNDVHNNNHFGNYNDYFSGWARYNHNYNNDYKRYYHNRANNNRTYNPKSYYHTWWNGKDWESQRLVHKFMCRSGAMTSCVNLCNPFKYDLRCALFFPFFLFVKTNSTPQRERRIMTMNDHKL